MSHIRKGSYQYIIVFFSFPKELCMITKKKLDKKNDDSIF